MKRSTFLLTIMLFLSLSCMASAAGNLFPVQLGKGKWGYIDNRGALLIPPRYDEAKPFFEGLAAVKMNGDWGYIDLSGKSRTGFVFSLAGSFSEGVAAVCRKNDLFMGYIDTDGKTVIEPAWPDAGEFSEGLAAVRKSISSGWGYIDRTGKEVIAPKFVMDAPRPFREGVAAVRMEGKWGYVDKTGTVVIEPRYYEALDFSEGVAMVRETVVKNRRYGSSLPVETSGGKCGFIDRKGIYAIPPQFDAASGFSEHLAPVRTGGLWGYIDRKGAMVIAPKFQLAENFSEGLAVVLLQSPPDLRTFFGYIDPSGRVAIKPVELFNAFGFSGGLAEVITQDNRTRYLTTSGTVLWSSGAR
jgi:hypothetical protein